MLLTDPSVSTTKPRTVPHHLKGKNVSLTESPSFITANTWGLSRFRCLGIQRSFSVIWTKRVTGSSLQK